MAKPLDPGKEIIKASKAGNVGRIKELLASDPGLLTARDTDDSTPLHCAVWKGQDAVVALLLDAGADVNLHNKNTHWGTTPLHAAAHANQEAIARMLLEHGANPAARDLEGRTPLDHTTFHKARAVAKILNALGG